MIPLSVLVYLKRAEVYNLWRLRAFKASSERVFSPNLCLRGPVFHWGLLILELIDYLGGVRSAQCLLFCCFCGVACFVYFSYMAYFVYFLYTIIAASPSLLGTYLYDLILPWQKAFLGKWLCKCAVARDGSWRRVIVEKCEEVSFFFFFFYIIIYFIYI